MQAEKSAFAIGNNNAARSVFTVPLPWLTAVIEDTAAREFLKNSLYENFAPKSCTSAQLTSPRPAPPARAPFPAVVGDQSRCKEQVPTGAATGAPKESRKLRCKREFSVRR